MIPFIPPSLLDTPAIVAPDHSGYTITKGGVIVPNKRLRRIVKVAEFHFGDDKKRASMPGMVGMWPNGKVSSRSLTAAYQNPNNVTSYTFSGLNIGAADPTRLLVVFVSYSQGSGTRTVSSASIGGVGLTKLHEQPAQSSTGLVEGATMLQAAVPSGTSANLVVNASGGNFGHCTGVIYALYNLNSQSCRAANGTRQTKTSSIATTLDIPASGIALGYVSYIQTTPGAISWGGLVEDYDTSPASNQMMGSASLTQASAQSGRTISATSTTQGPCALVCGAWA